MTLPPSTAPQLGRSVLVTLCSGVALFGSFTFVPLPITEGTRTHPAATGLLLMQAYALIAQARAPVGIMGATMATLSFARQIGGSASIALFGWITLLAAGPAGLSLAFALAALALAIALVTAPRSSHDSPVTEEPA